MGYVNELKKLKQHRSSSNKIYKSLNTVVLNPRKEFLARIDAISTDIDESHEAFHGEKMSLRSTLVT